MTITVKLSMPSEVIWAVGIFMVVNDNFQVPFFF